MRPVPLGGAEGEQGGDNTPRRIYAVAGEGMGVAQMSITTTITGKSGREHRLSVDYEGGVVDEGIGFYDCGGRQGIDVRMVPEVRSMIVEMVRETENGLRYREITPGYELELELRELCADEILDYYRHGGYE